MSINSSTNLNWWSPEFKHQQYSYIWPNYNAGNNGISLLQLPFWGAENRCEVAIIWPYIIHISSIYHPYIYGTFTLTLRKKGLPWHDLRVCTGSIFFMVHVFVEFEFTTEAFLSPRHFCALGCCDLIYPFFLVYGSLVEQWAPQKKQWMAWSRESCLPVVTRDLFHPSFRGGLLLLTPQKMDWDRLMIIGLNSRKTQNDPPSILLMVQKSGDHLLRLVVGSFSHYPQGFFFFASKRWLGMGFLNHQQQSHYTLGRHFKRSKFRIRFGFVEAKDGQNS